MSKCIEVLPVGVKGWILKHPTNPRWMTYCKYRDLSVARYLYEQHHHITLEANQQVNHSCGNSMCVNLLHLYLGSQRQNMKDKMRHGTSNKGRTWKLLPDKIHYKKLSPEVNEQIRRSYREGGLTQRALAQLYGVSQCRINKIIKEAP